MRLPVFRVVSVPVLSVVVALFVAAIAPAAEAAPTQVKIDIPVVRAIQLYSIAKEGAEAEDDVYLVVGGVAKGQEIQKRYPEQGSMKVAPKKPAFTPDKPAVLWEGELADGEFAYVTVVLMHGDGKDAAKFKEFQGKLDAAAKGVAERSKKTLTTEESDKLIEATLKAQREVITKV